MDQKEELVHILNTARSLDIEEIFFQVRPAGDALYRTSLAPASHYVTDQRHNGILNWDPLAFLLRETEARGMKVHAWLNMYRISPTQCGNHTSARKNDDILKRFCHGAGYFNWLDPGAEDVQNHVLNVVLEIISR